MRIKSFMIQNPITITEDASIEEAIELMKNNSIRHLPVVGVGKMLKGFVTLADMKSGLIPSMLAGLTLSDLMIKDPITVDPDSDVELAAQLIYKYKIGGIPVVKRGKLVGIITEIRSPSRLYRHDGDAERQFADRRGRRVAAGLLQQGRAGGAEPRGRDHQCGDRRRAGAKEDLSLPHVPVQDRAHP